MALLKALITESGVMTKYHNVTLIKDVTKGVLTAYVNSYVAKETREAGKPPVVDAKPYVVPQDEWKGKEGIETAAYAYLKTLPEFEGAEDV